MAKRGRPTVFVARTGSDVEHCLPSSGLGNKTRRTQASAYYVAIAHQVLKESGFDIPYLDEIYDCDPSTGRIRRKSVIIDQIGRLWDQDGESPEFVKEVATWAAKAYHDGLSAKQVAECIRYGRKTRDWGNLQYKVQPTLRPTKEIGTLLMRFASLAKEADNQVLANAIGYHPDELREQAESLWSQLMRQPPMD